MKKVQLGLRMNLLVVRYVDISPYFENRQIQIMGTRRYVYSRRTYFKMMEGEPEYFAAPFRLYLHQNGIVILFSADEERKIVVDFVSRYVCTVRYVTVRWCCCCACAQKLKGSSLLPLASCIYRAAVLIEIHRLTTTPERLVVAKKSFLHAMALRAIVKPVAKVQDRTSVLCLYRSARTHCLYFAALYSVIRILNGWHQLYIQKYPTIFTELLSRSFHA